MEHFGPKSVQMENADPEPGNGAAGPETLLNKGFREASLCAKTTFHTFSLLGTATTSDPKVDQ